MHLLMDLPLKKYFTVGEKVTEKKKWWVPILNRALDFVFTSFCPICDGQVFKDGYSYVCQECLDLLFGFGIPVVNFVEFPCRGWIFRGLLVLVAGRKTYFLIRAGVCLLWKRGQEISYMILNIMEPG